jgi:hypothetical protein
MSSPIKSLFGGGGGQQTNPLLAPLMILATQASAPASAPLATPLQTPMGGAGGSIKPAMSPSFAGAAAAPTQQQIGGKTLLGQ